LLLTTRFSKRGDDSAEPLTSGEYNRLAVAMNSAGLRPGALLADVGAGFLDDTEVHGLAPRRLHDLLERSMALAMALDAWNSTGLWVVSRADEAYPLRLRERLKGKAPILLFGCGEASLLGLGGLAVIGSRNVDEPGADFTRDVARSAAAESIQIISGGARGVDSISMESALNRGGTVVGVLANDLAKTSRTAQAREAITEDRLCLVSPFQPDSHFEAWKAMDRNKSIYGLSDWAVVVASDLRKGGTWAGAKENLDAGWVPLFVRAGEGVPKGNEGLIGLGGIPLMQEQVQELNAALEDGALVARETAASGIPETVQESLF
jgi:predicted Rossmann fold nucleotide-binding protein DprA/Smf involved in DNA uptake